MKQAVIKQGIVVSKSVPAPLVGRNDVVIKVEYSCISSGTESTSVSASGKSLIQRVLDKPEHIQRVLSMVKNEGLASTINTVKNKATKEVATGYSVAGEVIKVGADVSTLKVGDKVAAAGAGLANHAEYVNVPINLVIKLPDNVTTQQASTVTLGGIAMQGVRRADAKLGEFVLVVGAGILGLLTVQFLKASGTKVAVTDIDSSRLELAKKLGADIAINPMIDDCISMVTQWSKGHGADKTIFTAATSSNTPLSEAFQMTRKKGTLVMVGVSGNEVNREDIYAKELDFKISTSYGPGRYDSSYEDKGIDYPYAYVRWTENRNMESYLELIASGNVSVDELISDVYSINEVTSAFDSLKSPSDKPLMVLLEYSADEAEYLESTIVQTKSYSVSTSVQIKIGLIGTGGFVKNMHLPNLLKLETTFKIQAVMNRTGLTAENIANQYHAKYSTTDADRVINDPNIDLVFIGTRHGNHAELIIKALKADKHIFVEKPLCINSEELNEIEAYYSNMPIKPMLMVGFNRRFSKIIEKMTEKTNQRINPLYLRYRMSAGYLPAEHWAHEDGGRIIGECCHIIDLASAITKANPISINTETITPTNEYFSGDDNKIITIKYDDGSVAAIEYITVPSKSLSKEYMEVHFDGKSIIMDDYKTLKFYGCGSKDYATELSNKGHFEELEALAKSIRTNEPAIEFESIVNTTRLSFLAAEN